MVTWTTGFRHSSIPTAEKVLAQIGEKSGVYTVDYCRTQDDVTKMLTPQYLNQNHFDGVFFANTTGNLHIPDLHAFLDWIAAGHAFLGAHSASDTYHPRDTGDDTAYVDMLGGEFKTHNQQTEVEAIVDDPKHPAVKHLAPSWKVRDEIYEFIKNNRDKVHVLLSMNKHPNDGHPEAGQPGDYLLAWCKMYGKGRVFYTALGHREDVWESEPYQQHILGAIRWAFGLAKGDARPGNAVKAERGPIVPHVDCTDAELDTVLRAIHTTCGVDIVLDPPGKKPYHHVNVAFDNKPLEYILDGIARSAGAALYVEDETYHIGPKEVEAN